MPQAPDGSPSVSHASRVTQAGFTMIPNAVMLRGDLSVGAKLLYGYMKHLAWRNGHGPVDPPRDVVAADLNLSENTVAGYFRELQKACVVEGGPAELPTLVESKRRGQGRTNLYVIHDPGEPESVTARDAESEDPERQDRGRPARARSLSDPKRTSEAANAASDSDELDEPPKLTKIDGRDSAFDVLATVCRCTDRNALREVGLALNGTKGVVGIRQLAWDELQPAARAVYSKSTPAWEGYLTRAIQTRAIAYAGAMNGALLTPLALAKWWGRVEGMTGGAGLTAADIESLGQ